MENELTAVLRNDKLPKLDGLRAISALIVVLYHFGFNQVPAGFGVMTFFVISGFLITWLLLKENDRTGGVSLLGFYRRRSLRIFPAFYCYWLVAVVLLAIRHARILWPQAICSFLYVANYYQGLHAYPSSLFSHTWSLGVEEQFYLLWPAAFLWLRKSQRKMVYALVSVILLMWTCRVILHMSGTPEYYIYTSFETRSDEIFVGCLTAVILFHYQRARFWSWLYDHPFLIVANLAVLIASIVLGHRYGIAYRNIIGFSLDPVLVSLLMVQLLPRRERAFAWLDSRPVSYLGRISYSTYLYQQLVLPLVSHVVANSALRLTLSVLGTWLVAAVSYQIVELPFLRLRNGRLGPTRDSALVPSHTAKVEETP